MTPNIRSRIIVHLPLAGIVSSLLLACGASDSLYDSTRISKPNRQQSDGSGQGANNTIPIGQQSSTQAPEIYRFRYDPEVLKKSSQKIGGIDFDYFHGLATLHPIAPTVRFKTTNSQLTQLGKNLVVVIAGYPMNHSAMFTTRITPTMTQGTGVSFRQK